MKLYIPCNYRPLLDQETMELAIKMLKIIFQEALSNIHSLYVDQWDWERTISAEQRTVGFLKCIVEKIYETLKETEKKVYSHYPHITPVLPEQITFIHSEDLLNEYPVIAKNLCETFNFQFSIIYQ